MSRPHISLANLSLSSVISLFSFRNLAKAARQALAICLIVILSANHSLTAPGIAGAIAGVTQELSLRWYASGWAAKFNFALFKSPGAQTPQGWDGKGAPPRPRPEPQSLETKEDRERKIARVQIFPSDITIETGQQAAFASARPGKFKLTADIAGRKAHVKVTVTGLERKPNITSPTSEPVSSSDKPKPNRTPTTPPTRFSTDCWLKIEPIRRRPAELCFAVRPSTGIAAAIRTQTLTTPIRLIVRRARHAPKSLTSAIR